jgi:hypothetical protein
MDDAQAMLEGRDLMTGEWEAWRWLCRELESLGFVVNDQERLVAAIKVWGERLVALRLANPQHIEAARAEFEEEYRRLTGGDYPEVT